MFNFPNLIVDKITKKELKTWKFKKIIVGTLSSKYYCKKEIKQIIFILCHR